MTLAAQIFRAFMVIIVTFDLEAAQLDSVNMFLNSSLDEVIYIEYSEGYEKEEFCLQLKHALYSLWCSPLLWQQELSRSLTEFSLEPTPKKLCIWIQKSEDVILFYFVDDIVILACKEN